MCAATVRVETLMALEPIASLSEARLRELAGLCRMERVSRNSDPFLERGIAGQTVYLVKGELALAYPDAPRRCCQAAPIRREPRSGGVAQCSPAPGRSPTSSWYASTMNCST